MICPNHRQNDRLVTMDDVIQILRGNPQAYKQIENFSQKPGIYAVFFVGMEFPLPNASPSPQDIIYVGKSQESQEARDANTHFKTGKTGSSTLRKTIGALLREKYNLVPIPRNENEYLEKKRRSHYKFDCKSERIITCWMRSNLALSFFEFESTNMNVLDSENMKYITSLKDLEKTAIKKISPMFNLQNVTDKSYLKPIKGLRKKCADIACGKNKIKQVKKCYEK